MISTISLLYSNKTDMGGRNPTHHMWFIATSIVCSINKISIVHLKHWKFEIIFWPLLKTKNEVLFNGVERKRKKKKKSMESNIKRENFFFFLQDRISTLT